MKRILSKEFWSERDMEILIGKLLRYGVFLSCGITIIGGILYLQQCGGVMPDYSPVQDNVDFKGVADYLRHFSSIFSGVLALDGAAIIQLGVCVLVATPILRVAVSAIAFLIEKDKLYFGITLLVLAIIIGNMLLGLH